MEHSSSMRGNTRVDRHYDWKQTDMQTYKYGRLYMYNCLFIKYISHKESAMLFRSCIFKTKIISWLVLFVVLKKDNCVTIKTIDLLFNYTMTKSIYIELFDYVWTQKKKICSLETKVIPRIWKQLRVKKTIPGNRSFSTWNVTQYFPEHIYVFDTID